MPFLNLGKFAEHSTLRGAVQAPSLNAANYNQDGGATLNKTKDLNILDICTNDLVLARIAGRAAFSPGHPGVGDGDLRQSQDHVFLMTSK